MHESKVEMEFEEEMKDVCRIIEILESHTKMDLEGDLKKVNTEEMGDVIDMIKDMYESKAHAAKACYYKMLMKEMEEESEMGMRAAEPMRMYFPVQGGGPYRDSSGQSGSESWRDSGSREGRDMRNMPGVDRTRVQPRQRPGKVDGSPSRRGFSFDEYIEAKEMYPGHDQEHKQMRIDTLNRELNDLLEMGKEVVQDMSPEEKQVWKGKISKIMNL